MSETSPDGPAGDDLQRICELRVAARADRLKLVRATVAQAAACCGCDPDGAADLVIAVDEGCQNVVRYAYPAGEEGDIVVRVACDDERVVVWLIDFAPPIAEPERIRPRDLDDLRPGGLGTHFIRETVDEAGFERAPEGAGNVLRMVKRIKR